MKPVLSILCLTLLLGTLGLSASARNDGAAAAEATPTPTASSAPNQDQPLAPADDGPPSRFSHISTEQGLSSSEVWSVLRDRRGFMWFGTLDGLNRYDGYKMKVFKYALTDPTSLSDNKIRTVYEDRAGTLWIGTWNGGLNRYERESETFTRFQHDPDDPDQPEQRQASMPSWRIGPESLWLGTRGWRVESLRSRNRRLQPLPA